PSLGRPSIHPSALAVCTTRGREVRNGYSLALLHPRALPHRNIVARVGQVSDVVDDPLITPAIAVNIPLGAGRKAGRINDGTSRDNPADKGAHSAARERRCGRGNGVGRGRPAVIQRVPGSASGLVAERVGISLPRQPIRIVLGKKRRGGGEDTAQVHLRLRLPSLGLIGHEVRDGDRSEDPDDRHHDHQLDQGKTLIPFDTFTHCPFLLFSESLTILRPRLRTARSRLHWLLYV